MTYRDNPEWLAAQSEIVRNMEEEESADDACSRRMVAAFRMYEIERSCL